MKRVMIIGDAGSGKSTLARWLGAQTGLPVHHLDGIFWMEGWTPRPEAEKLAMVGKIEAQGHWIIEGNVSATFENRIARADVLIWLDLPVGLRLWRVVRRTLEHWGRPRPELPAGCTQRLDRHMASFLAFIWQDRHAGRARMAACRAMAREGMAVYHLTSLPALRAFQQVVASR